MAISKKLDSMDYNDFVGAHGGRRTAALAGRFRRAKGLSVNPTMQNAILEEAQRRARAQTDRGIEVDLASPGKPLPGVTHDMLGPPDAPPVGGRTQPGTTPRAGWKQQKPGMFGPELSPGGSGDLLKRYPTGPGLSKRLAPGDKQSWVAPVNNVMREHAQKRLPASPGMARQYTPPRKKL